MTFRWRIHRMLVISCVVATLVVAAYIKYSITDVLHPCIFFKL